MLNSKKSKPFLRLKKSNFSLGVICLLLILFLLPGCCDKEEVSKPEKPATEPPVAEVTPPDLPDPGIPGFNFPEPELTLDNWVFSGNNQEIYLHAWGIWTALTMESGVTILGEPLRAFETWLTPAEMLQAMDGVTIEPMKRRHKLERPRQFRNKAKKIEKTAVTGPDTNIFVSVAYNPAASNHAIMNKLFWGSTLTALLKYGYKDIPNFPVSAVTIKPVFKVIQQSNLQEGLYSFPVWPGTPEPAKAFDEPDWNTCVYVDIKNNGQGNGSIDMGCSGPTPETTYNLTDFIYNTITAEDAAYLSSQLGLQNVAAGDYVILVGMHVTSREMKRWAWQTFWWSANPDAPFAPSSLAIAAARPTQLTGPARHYAMAAAYQMIVPAQPLDGGVNVGEPLYAFNPYLEAGFDTSVFQVIRPIETSQGPVTNDYGVQTNCMSCHGLAQFNPTPGHYDDSSNRQKPYGADFYLPLHDGLFQGMLKVDFAWSIIGAMDLSK